MKEVIRYLVGYYENNGEFNCVASYAVGIPQINALQSAKQAAKYDKRCSVWQQTRDENGAVAKTEYRDA